MKYTQNPFLQDGAPHVSFIDAVLEREVSMDYPEVSVDICGCVSCSLMWLVEKSDLVRKCMLSLFNPFLHPKGL